MSLKRLNEDNKGFVFYWKIAHFSLCSLLKEDLIKSPAFRIEEMDNTEWNLNLYPDRESKGNVVLNIKRQNEDDGPKCIYVDIKLFLLKANGEIVIEEIENVCFELTFYLIKPLEQKRSTIFGINTLFLPDDILTVGCFIKKHSNNMSASTECTAYTDISTEQFSFAFPFNTSQQQIKTTLKSSVSKKYPIFKIVLDPHLSNNDSEFKTVKIVMENWICNVLCKCKLSVENAKNKVVFLFEGKRKYSASEHEQSWNLTNSVNLFENKPNISKDSSFVLRCVLVVSDGTLSSHIKEIIYPVSALQIKQMDFKNIPAKQSTKRKLKRLLEDNSLCDFTLQVDGKKFRTHKVVLGAASPVFRAMFEREMKEKENSMSNIKDIDESTMQKLIDFAYTENVGNLEWESAIKLYIAADKYQISELKQFCAVYLIANLTIENVTEVLTISDTYQDSTLEKKAGDFVFAHANAVCRSGNWKTFIERNRTVATKIMQNMCLKFTSNPIF